MNVADVLKRLESLGNESTVKTFRRHGATGDMYGVKVADLKKVLRDIKGDQSLALELWDTGNSDAMYLAGLAADGSQMTKTQLEKWVKSAYWYMLSEYSVPFVAAEHPDCFTIARKWIKSRKESIAASGWCTYAGGMSVRSDGELDLGEIDELLQTVVAKIDSSPGRVRYCMNGFVICVGTYVKPLLKKAKATAKKIGAVEVDMGDTACRVPVATDMLNKVESMQRVGKKRKTVKC
ncbi:MAG: DNA alkylation repair protein [Aureliella sp.]